MLKKILFLYKKLTLNRKKKIIFNINKLKISNYSHPLIVPEIGINHSGNIETAFKIVDAAKRAGAKIIKHQTHIADDEYFQLLTKISKIYRIESACLSANHKVAVFA